MAKESKMASTIRKFPDERLVKEIGIAEAALAPAFPETGEWLNALREEKERRGRSSVPAREAEVVELAARIRR